MSTAPFAASTPALLAGGAHRADYALYAAHPSWPASVALDVVDLRVSWDETRSPRCTAIATVPAATAAALDLDPLSGVRLRVHAGYITAAGTRDVHLVADLGLRSRTTRDPGGLVELYAAGREAFEIDRAPRSRALPYIGPNYWTTTAAAIAYLVTGPITYTTEDVDPGPPVAVDLTGDLFDTVKDLADSIGADLYDDGTGTWRLGPRPVLAGTPAASLSTGPGGTIVDVTADDSRTGWANDVTLVYTWRPPDADADQIVVGRAWPLGDLFGGGPVGYVRHVEDRAMEATPERARAAAAALLRRMLSRSHTLRVTAVAAWWLRPGMTVRVAAPGLTTRSHLVSAIDFDAARGEMTFTTRLPPSDITITTA